MVGSRSEDVLLCAMASRSCTVNTPPFVRKSSPFSHVRTLLSAQEFELPKGTLAKMMWQSKNIVLPPKSVVLGASTRYTIGVPLYFP